MNAKMDKFIKCGDQAACKNCDFVKKNSGLMTSEVGYHSLNALGRCDFYEGSDLKVVKVG